MSTESIMAGIILAQFILLVWAGAEWWYWERRCRKAEGKKQ